MNAHIFDIDGTLLDSYDADAELYAAAVCKVFGLPSVSTDWASYRHVTDGGVLLELSSSGFPVRNVCVSTSSEFLDRVSIMRGALASAPPGIERITYYGDGTWDQEAVRELGWHLVPVGEKLGGLQHYFGAAGHLSGHLA